MFAHSQSVPPCLWDAPSPNPPGAGARTTGVTATAPAGTHRDGPGQARSPGDGQAHAWVCSDHPSSLPFSCCLHKRSVGGGTQISPEGPSIATPRRTEQRSQGDRGQPPGAPRAEIWGSQPSAQLTLGMAQTEPREVLGSGTQPLPKALSTTARSTAPPRAPARHQKQGRDPLGGRDPAAWAAAAP